MNKLAYVLLTIFVVMFISFLVGLVGWKIVVATFGIIGGSALVYWLIEIDRNL